MQSSRNENRLQYSTFESVVLTCMMGEHSILLDLKRLLGAMKKEAAIKISVEPARKVIYIELFQKLKNIAVQTGVDYIA
jgi:CRISPR/Cas system-associated endoribonuclease Cas2